MILSMNYSSDKLSMPDLPTTYIQRQSLLQTFQNCQGKRLFYIHAPSGYGKTVSTCLLIKECNYQAIWIALDEYDNIPVFFYKLLCAGLQSVQRDNTSFMAAIREPAFGIAPIEQTFAALLELENDGKQYALVFDDMHLIVHDEIKKSLPYILKRLPSNFTTFILSHETPNDYFYLAIDKHKLEVIDSSKLAFSSHETKTCFDAYGYKISLEKIRMLQSITDGWPIGINTLAANGEVHIGEYSGKVLANYFKKQIWSKWSQEKQMLALKTSLLDEFSIPLCVELTGLVDCKELLKQLVHENILMHKCGDEIYRYHHLFLEFFRKIAWNTDGIDKQQIYKTATDYWSNKNEQFTARKYAIKSGDAVVILATAVQYDSTESSVDDYVNFYQNYFKNSITEEICKQYPYLYTSHAWYHFLIGNAKEMQHNLDDIYANLPIIMQQYPEFIGMIFMLAGLDVRTNLVSGLEGMAQIPDIGQSSKEQKGASFTLQLPFIHRSSRDFYMLSDEQAFSICIETYRKVLPEKLDSLVLGITAGIRYEQNMLVDSLLAALQMKKLITDKTDFELVFSTYMHLLQAYQGIKNKEAFDETISELNLLIQEKNAPYVQPNLSAFLTRTAMLDGDTIEAEKWLNKYYVTQNRHVMLYKIYQAFTTIRANMVLGNFDKALVDIELVKRLAIDFDRKADLAEAHMLQSIMEWSRGNKSASIASMKKALMEVQDYGFVRIFSNEGATVLPILQKMRKQKESYAGDIRFLNKAFQSAYEQSNIYKGMFINLNTKPTKLSKQQRHMLQLLAQGYGNAQIIELTGLSINTIKRHQTLAYEKLGVNNAADAVVRAKELGII